VRKPLVSIIIPCYNQSQYLPETLDSVLAQKYTNWECIIINDGSTDNTDEIALSYCKTDDRFHYFKKLNGGVSSARNYGIQFACGEYIQFLDSDDLLSENKIQLQIEDLSNQNFEKDIVSVVKHLYFYDNDINCIDINGSALDVICHDYKNPLELIIDAWKNNTGFCLHAWLINKSLVDKSGPWNETIIKNEDGEYISRILYLAKKISFCPMAYALYRHNPTSICNINDPRKEFDQLTAIRLIIERIKEYRYDNNVKNAIYALYINYLYPGNLFSDYSSEFKKDLKSLGFNFDLINRGRTYRLLYKTVGKKVADKIYYIKNKLKKIHDRKKK